jgi:4-hydroxy-tetrahydrodipicolinate reductase
MELAGLFVARPEKAGRDAGELCGLAPTGVVATDDPEAVLAVEADCALYMPRAYDLDHLCRLLASGTDVVSTLGELNHPAGLDPELRERIEAACAQGGTSIHCTGSSPGFITEAVPIVLTSLQRRLDSLTIDEFADLSQRDSPALLFDVMGFGRPPTPFDERRAGHLRDSFGPSLEAFAAAIGMPLDRVEASGELATTTRRVDIAAGPLEAGTVGGQRITVSGHRGDRELVRFRASWYCTTELDVTWDLQDTGWRVVVDGDTPLDVRIQLPIGLDQMAEVSPGLTAHRAVNAVPVVCAAAPGIRTTADLPQVIAHLGEPT